MPTGRDPVALPLCLACRPLLVLTVVWGTRTSGWDTGQVTRHAGDGRGHGCGPRQPTVPGAPLWGIAAFQNEGKGGDSAIPKGTIS